MRSDSQTSRHLHTKLTNAKIRQCCDIILEKYIPDLSKKSIEVFDTFALLREYHPQLSQEINGKLKDLVERVSLVVYQAEAVKNGIKQLLDLIAADK